ncbi:hypothetical protein SMIDD26_00629 [Streptococcus mitis]|uniref:Uncharacterized protein n=1 Tax=Streptococcus mitis TaxID=28037 RepID=A0A139PVN6_STRMT|nr:hypothetical protein SMIDD26_00629 [Streptococcus mitis]
MLRKNSKTLTDKNKMVIIKNGLKVMMTLLENLFKSAQLCLAVFRAGYGEFPSLIFIY